MDGLVTRGLAAALALTIAGCSGANPDERFVADAADALGGRDRVAAVTTMIMEGEGRVVNLGQDMTWEATTQGFELTDYHRVVDLAGGAARTDQTRTPDFPVLSGPDSTVADARNRRRHRLFGRGERDRVAQPGGDGA